MSAMQEGPLLAASRKAVTNSRLMQVSGRGLGVTHIVNLVLQGCLTGIPAVTLKLADKHDADSEGRQGRTSGELHDCMVPHMHS